MCVRKKPTEMKNAFDHEIRLNLLEYKTFRFDFKNLYTVHTSSLS